MTQINNAQVNALVIRNNTIQESANQLAAKVAELEATLANARVLYAQLRDEKYAIAQERNTLAADVNVLTAQRDSWKGTATILASGNQQRINAAKATVYALLPDTTKIALQCKAKAQASAQGGTVVTTPAIPATASTLAAPATRTALNWRGQAALIMSKKAEEEAAPVEEPCCICGQYNVKPNVANYSLRKYGKVACRTCQATLKAQEAAAKATAQANTQPAPAAPAQTPVVESQVTIPATIAVGGEDIVF